MRPRPSKTGLGPLMRAWPSASIGAIWPTPWNVSAFEALERQAPFINQTIANHALALLALLFREGAVDYCGGFIDLKTGHCSPIPVGLL
jgi:hypothetical protein